MTRPTKADIARVKAAGPWKYTPEEEFLSLRTNLHPDKWGETFSYRAAQESAARLLNWIAEGGLDEPTPHQPACGITRPHIHVCMADKPKRGRRSK